MLFLGDYLDRREEPVSGSWQPKILTWALVSLRQASALQVGEKHIAKFSRPRGTYGTITLKPPIQFPSGYRLLCRFKAVERAA
jgi:hypothetical protein